MSVLKFPGKCSLQLNRVLRCVENNVFVFDSMLTFQTCAYKYWYFDSGQCPSL